MDKLSEWAREEGDGQRIFIKSSDSPCSRHEFLTHTALSMNITEGGTWL
jgi:hypothetical protein